jgi:hypothetical protein
MNEQAKRRAPRSWLRTKLVLAVCAIWSATESCSWGAEVFQQLEKTTSYESLLPKAGKPDRGLVLEARMSPNESMQDSPPVVVLSVKNVRDQPNEFLLPAMRAVPEIFVRDERGRPVAMTNDGVKLYKGPWWRRTVGDCPFLKLDPGEAIGSSYELGRYFRLDKPGNYTVLLWASGVQSLGDLKENRGPWESGLLVADPLRIKVTASSRPGERRVKQAPRPSSGSSEVLSRTRDKVWTALAARGGTPVEGCVLEVTDSLANSGKGELIASVICLEGQYEGRRPVALRDSTDFQVLIRDDRGHTVKPISPGAIIPPRKQTTGSRFTSLVPGDGIGALIQLSNLFDLKQGEYWVLVSLPSVHEGKADLVAKPIKIRINANSSRSTSKSQSQAR